MAAGLEWEEIVQFDTQYPLLYNNMMTYIPNDINNKHSEWISII